MATIEAQIRIRRDTAANFTSADPTLALGEIAYETDTGNLKIGTGTTAWTSLAYINPYRGNAVAQVNNTVLGSNAGASLQSGATSNTFIGLNVGDNTTTGSQNTAVGARALDANSGGSSSVAIGYEALRFNNASNLTAVGSQALDANTTGIQNTAVGYQALSDNATGGSNTAVGHAALANSTASANTAIGSGALFTNVSGSGCTAVGIDALLLNTVSDGTAVGAYALDANTTGTQNTAVGRNALGANTTGQINTAVGNGALHNNTVGEYNVAFGTSALFQNIDGDFHSALGRSAMSAVTGGTQSTGVGNSSLLYETTGNKNTALGGSSGAFFNVNSPLTSASESVFLGWQAKAAGDAQTNQIVIGANALGNGSNTTTIGNSSVVGTYIPAGTLYLQGTTDSTDKDTGALVVEGGVGIEKNLSIGGNASLSGYTEGVVAIGTVDNTGHTFVLTNGTVQTATLTASTATTFTMPTATAGKSFTVFLKQAATTGNGTATFTNVKWNDVTPVVTPTAGKMDIFTFVADGTNWYGSVLQGFTP